MPDRHQASQVRSAATLVRKMSPSDALTSQHSARRTCSCESPSSGDDLRAVAVQGRRMPDSCCAPSAPARHSAPVATPVMTRPVSTAGMVELSGGEFLMGNAGSHAYPDDGEGPVRRVRLDPFWIDAEAVPNATFARFVEETGHVPEAERFGWS